MPERVVHRIRGTEAGVTAFGLYGRPNQTGKCARFGGLALKWIHRRVPYSKFCCWSS